MPGKKVRVKVTKKDVPNNHAQPLSFGEILLDIPLWIDNDRGFTGLVGDQIRGMGQTAQVVLLEEHSTNSRSPGMTNSGIRPSRRPSEPSATDANYQALARSVTPM